MLAITILLIVSFGLFCLFAHEDVLEKTSLTVYARCIMLFILASLIGCLFLLQDEFKQKAILDYENGRYKIETVVKSDTTYFIKKNK